MRLFTKQKLRAWGWFFAFLLALIPAHASEPWRLEGVVEDANPAQSLAIINGNLYKVGDSVGSLRILEIGSHSVKLRDNATGKESLLTVSEAPKPAAGDEKVIVKSGSFLEQAKSYLSNPGQAVNRVWEMQALRELALINNAAVKYYNKYEFFPVGMRQLTLDGFLAKSYEEGKIGKYKFYFKNRPQSPDDFQLHADPLDTASGLLFFFVGADAVIRESSGNPAHAKSPMHHYMGMPEKGTQSAA